MLSAFKGRIRQNSVKRPAPWGRSGRRKGDARVKALNNVGRYYTLHTHAQTVGVSARVMNAPLHMDKPRAHDGEAERLSPGRLWSLWDMLEENAVTFMELGKQLYDITAVFDSDSYSQVDKKTGARRLVPEAVDDVQQQLRAILKIARKLNRPASIGVLERQVQFVDTCPQTEREIELVRNIFESEIGARKCLFIPSHL
jgi:hypothetical protein